MTTTATDKSHVRRRRAFTRRDKLTLGLFVGVPTALHFGFGLDTSVSNYWAFLHLLDWNSLFGYQMGWAGKLPEYLCLQLQLFGMRYKINIILACLVFLDCITSGRAAGLSDRSTNSWSQVLSIGLLFASNFISCRNGHYLEFHASSGRLC